MAASAQSGLDQHRCVSSAQRHRRTKEPAAVPQPPCGSRKLLTARLASGSGLLVLTYRHKNKSPSQTGPAELNLDHWTQPREQLDETHGAMPTPTAYCPG